MSDIHEQIELQCPYELARPRLHAILQEESDPRLPLSLQLTVNVPHTGIEFAKDVSVEYTMRPDPAHIDEPWHVHWEPQPGGVYPSFDGTLTVHASGRPNASILELVGSYAPPLGLIGAAFDRVVGHRIAVSTAQNLLHGIGSGIEGYDRVHKPRVDARIIDDVRAKEIVVRVQAISTVIQPALPPGAVSGSDA